MKEKFYGMVGKEYGRLRVIGVKRVRGRVICECECGCGRLSEVNANNLEYGLTKSCGCLRLEMLQEGKKIDERREVEILERCERGESKSKLAKEYGVSRNAIYLLLKKRGK